MLPPFSLLVWWWGMHRVEDLLVTEKGLQPELLSFAE